MSYRAVTLVLLLGGLVCLAAPRQAAADYLGGVTFSHPTPSYLPNGETVFINIDYIVSIVVLRKWHIVVLSERQNSVPALNSNLGPVNKIIRQWRRFI